LTRIGPDKTYDQAKSRILFRKRHLQKIPAWAMFWLVIFPASTAVYFWHILRAPHDKAKTLAAYLKGTFDGVATPLHEIPEIGSELTKAEGAADGLR
jgi:hypothetical protein